jgi:hypothetical protein
MSRNQLLSQRWFLRTCAFVVTALSAGVSQLHAQSALPKLGYVYPPGVRAGSTVEVQLGGYNFTPDMQFFVHDPRIKLEILGPPGKLIEPPPPYWFGAKAGNPPMPFPREVPARLTVPADLPPGPVEWQVANANGSTATSVFIVGTDPEVLEAASGKEPQQLPSLPVTVYGRISRISEIDRYRFTTAEPGIVRCQVQDRLGQPFYGVFQIRDAAGNLIVDTADTEGSGTDVSFIATVGGQYTVSLNDLDFRGDRAFIYRLNLTRGPHIVTAFPATGRRGETRQVEFTGTGLATGSLKVESVVRQVAFPSDPQARSFVYRLETPHGATSFELPLSEVEEKLAPSPFPAAGHRFDGPTTMTGVLDTPAEHVYLLAGKKGDAWRISVEAQKMHSTVDAALTVLGPEDKELARGDDLLDSTDAAVEFTMPMDGEYRIAVGDVSGRTPSRASIYRLVVEPLAGAADFSIEVGDRLDIYIGGKADLPVKVIRYGKFAGPVTLSVTGLPPGVTTSGELIVDAKNKKGDFKIPLVSAENTPCIAVMASVTAKGQVGEESVEHTGGRLLVASTMKPRCKISPVDPDGGRTVHRGTTYPAPVIVERLEGFTGEILLQQSAQQERHRRGITGSDLVVPPGVDRVNFPIYLPEYLETSLTCRMVLNGVAQVPDPQGKVRYVASAMSGRITMSMEGALLKLTPRAGELTVRPGDAFDVPVTVGRSAKLQIPARVELVPSEELAGCLSAEPLTVPTTQTDAILHIQTRADLRLSGPLSIKLRVTALQEGKYPAVSEIEVPVVFKP